MNKELIMRQDYNAFCGDDDAVWIPSRSTVDLGQGPGMIPMVGIPDDVIEELRAETAAVAAIMPSNGDLQDLLTPRIWTYFIRRAGGQVEQRVTVVDQRGEGTTVDAMSVIPQDTLGTISAWMFEQWIKPAPEIAA